MGKHQTHFVSLTAEERNFLERHCKNGTWKPREIIRAQILLLSDYNSDNPLEGHKIAEKLKCSLSNVAYRRKRFADTGSIEETLFDKPRKGRPTIVEGAVDAHMTKIACSHPPKGHAKWSLRLIKDRMVSLEIIETISHTTVGSALKKKKLSLG